MGTFPILILTYNKLTLHKSRVTPSVEQILNTLYNHRFNQEEKVVQSPTSRNSSVHHLNMIIAMNLYCEKCK